MSLSTVFLLSLTIPVPEFLSSLTQSSHSPPPTFAAKVVNWAFRPTKLSINPLLTQDPPWDILLIFPGATQSLPPALDKVIRAQWSITFEEEVDANSSFQRLIGVQAGQETSPLTGAWRHDLPPEVETEEGTLELKMTTAMQKWISALGQQEDGKGQVSMFNLMAFEDSSHRMGYMRYVDEFVKGTGTRWGGKGKVAGNVVSCSSTAEGVHEWDTMVIAQYPSIYHFAEMLVSEDYQEIDRKYRAGNLRDTLILCTLELEL